MYLYCDEIYNTKRRSDLRHSGWTRCMQANEAFHELLFNWIAFVKPLGIPIMVGDFFSVCLSILASIQAKFDYSTQVGALDDTILERCKAAGVPAVLLQVCDASSLRFTNSFRLLTHVLL